MGVCSAAAWRAGCTGLKLTVLVVEMAFYALIERSFMIPGWPHELRARFTPARP